MTENDKNMIAGLPFEAVAKEIGAIITGLQVIQSMAESNAARNLADEALIEALLAEVHLTKAQQIVSEEDVHKLADLDQDKSLAAFLTIEKIEKFIIQLTQVKNELERRRDEKRGIKTPF